MPDPGEHIVHKSVAILADAAEELINLALGEGSADHAKERLREARAELAVLFPK